MCETGLSRGCGTGEEALALDQTYDEDRTPFESGLEKEPSKMIWQTDNVGHIAGKQIWCNNDEACGHSSCYEFRLALKIKSFNYTCRCE